MYSNRQIPAPFCRKPSEKACPAQPASKAAIPAKTEACPEVKTSLLPSRKQEHNFSALLLFLLLELLTEKKGG